MLECDHVPASLREVGDDYGPMFLRRFADHAPWVALDRIDVVGGAALPSLDDYDAFLVTGSRHSSYDDLPWIAPLGRFVADAVDAEVPVAGVCFGHQLIAQQLGGKVERAGVGWSVGIHRAQVVARRPWMQPDAEAFHPIVSHQDQVVELPPDAHLIATSDHAPVAAFEVGSAVGFQGHPEFHPAYAAALMAARRDRIPAEVIAAGEASLATATDHAAVVAWLGRFLAGRATDELASGRRKGGDGRG